MKDQLKPAKEHGNPDQKACAINEITDAFEDLSHALRVLLEADIRAHRQGLIQIDRAEAVGSIHVEKRDGAAGVN